MSVYFSLEIVKGFNSSVCLNDVPCLQKYVLPHVKNLLFAYTEKSSVYLLVRNIPVDFILFLSYDNLSSLISVVE